MNPQKIEKLVEDLVTPIIKELGYEVVDIEFKDLGEDSTLTLFIYKEGGITIADCKTVNNAVYEPLDELDPTDDQPYSLNVSSPGLDRPFKTLRDFERNLGEEIEIEFNTSNKSKKIVGVLKNIENNILTINEKGKFTSVELNSIIKALPFIKF